MVPNGVLLRISTGSTAELLLLSGAGALLAHLGHMSATVCTALAQSLVLVFLPALLFGSILETVTSARAGSAPVHELVYIVAWATTVLAVGGIVGMLVVAIVARKKEVAVKRAVFACVTLGNANTLPLLLMNGLCDGYGPIRDDPECVSKSTGYIALFLIAWNVATWTLLLRYLTSAPDSSPEVADSDGDDDGVEMALHPTRLPQTLEFIEGQEEDNVATPPKRAKQRLLSPPFLAILVAFVIAFIPILPNALLDKDGVLRPFLLSTKLMGNMAVPASSLIVGARLYNSQREVRAQTQIFPFMAGIPKGVGCCLVYRRSPFLTRSVRTSLCFERCYYDDDGQKSSGAFAHVTNKDCFGPRLIPGTIVVARLIVIPFLGRMIYRSIGISSFVSKPLMRIFMLVVWNAPTANNVIVLVSFAAAGLPRIGPQLQTDVAAALLWQYIATPIFLTINTALSLRQINGKS